MEKLKVLRSEKFFELLEDYFSNPDYDGKIIEVLSPAKEVDRYYFNRNIKTNWINYFKDDEIVKRSHLNYEKIRKEHEKEKTDGVILRYIAPYENTSDPFLSQCSIQPEPFKDNKMLLCKDTLHDRLIYLLFGLTDKGYNVMEFSAGPLTMIPEKYVEFFNNHVDPEPKDCFAFYRIISEEEFNNQHNEWENNTGKYLTPDVDKKIWKDFVDKKITFEELKEKIENE